MKQLATCRLTLLAIIALLASAPAIVLADATLAPGLSDLVSRGAAVSDSVVHVVVFLEEGSSAAGRIAPKAALSRGERITQVTSSLKSAKGLGQDDVHRFLQQYARSEIRRFWIAPAFETSVPVNVLDDLGSMYGVRLVVENVPLRLIEPVEERAADATMATSASQPLQQMKVPALWQRGLKGTGRLVCSFDTGVDYDHPALLSKWRGNDASLAEVWFSKVAPNSLPSDVSGHGTHTMGLMVGHDGADTIGVAPAAKWITGAVIDQGRPLGTTIADILEAFQWALDPDGNPATTEDVPDVILNSWGIPKGLFTPCDMTFATVIANVETAGIVVIFAAGNEGPNAVSLRNPADMALTTLSSFSVGAVDASNVIASFSSRGPSSCNQAMVKPEIVAPGVAIRSSHLNGEYKLLSGTSMSAPYIAGLVALMREYNPNATVDQIKGALISAAVDLGTPGEDNAYGHGIIDASRLLEYIPNPFEPEFSLSSVSVLGGGLAMPGEQFSLQLTVSNPAGNVSSVIGTIRTRAISGVTIDAGQALFTFGTGGTTAVNTTSLTISFAESLVNGESMPFDLELAYNLGADVDTLPFSLTVGVAPTGTFATHRTQQLDMTVSDFGMFGLAEGSIYNARGEGFVVDGGDNLLYEAGIMLGRSSVQVSSSVRGADGLFAPTDFAPASPLSDEWIGLDGGTRRSARFDDREAPVSIPITVSQETACYPTINNNGLLIVKFLLHNTTLEGISNLHLGLLVDFDMVSPESLEFDAEMNMMLQSAVGQPGAALVGLKNVTSFKAFDNNDTSKIGFTRSQLFNIISTPGVEIGAPQSVDRFFIASAGPFAIKARDSVEIAFAFVGGADMNELYANARTARQLYDQATNTDDGRLSGLPGSYELHQNYPNPFNPSTTISFVLPRAADVAVRVYNTLGQEVAVVHEGQLAAGRHSIDWSAGGLASGVYFYRLVADEAQLTRKMVLVK